MVSNLLLTAMFKGAYQKLPELCCRTIVRLWRFGVLCFGHCTSDNKTNITVNYRDRLLWMAHTSTSFCLRQEDTRYPSVSQ